MHEHDIAIALDPSNLQQSGLCQYRPESLQSFARTPSTAKQMRCSQLGLRQTFRGLETVGS